MSNFVALIVEDDPFQRECLASLLKTEGLEVVECANGESRNWCCLQPALNSVLS
jgi:CheY-like chemotaxis protein